jgi:hypothetical protein
MSFDDEFVNRLTAPDGATKFHCDPLDNPAPEIVISLEPSAR